MYDKEKFLDSIITDKKLDKLAFEIDPSKYIEKGDYIDFGPYGKLYIVEKTADGHAWVKSDLNKKGKWLINLKLAVKIIDRNGAKK